VPRFSYALLGALALHGSTLLLRAWHPRLPASPVLKDAPAPVSVELEEFALNDPPVEQTPIADALSDRAQRSPPASLSNRAAGALPKPTIAEVEAVSEVVASGEPRLEPITAGSADATDGLPPRKIDLGLDGHFFLHDPAPVKATGPAPAAELGPRVRKSSAQRQLEAALSADDIQRGLARGNALLGSLNTAARSEGPLRGEAVFRATVAADGSFGSVELLRGTAAEWASVLNAFRKLAASKHVRLPAGAKGLRVTFSVKAKVQRPSGKEVSDTAIGVAAPSLAPNGLVPSGDFDLADLGAGSQRLIYARVVSEEVL
jgi:hypothetical protein